LIFKEQTRSILIRAKEMVHLGSAVISMEQIKLIIFTVVLLSATAWILHSTSIGRRIRATVAHSQAAESLGISSALLHRLVFIISGTLAAIAGIYVGIDQNLTPVLGFTITIKAYAALIAGGKGNIWGAVIASYFIAAIEQLAVGIKWFGYYLPAGYQGSVALMLIIVLLLIKPTGLFGRTSRFA
ncbi:MAG: Inner-membrane translocator, partial [Candidatus Peregrinibacteria bacterium GW2011_GWA2_47_7]